MASSVFLQLFLYALHPILPEITGWRGLVHFVFGCHKKMHAIFDVIFIPGLFGDPFLSM